MSQIWGHVYELLPFEIGTPEHKATLAWLEANGIPVDRTPQTARFALFEELIQIRLFDTWIGPSKQPIRFISMDLDGFAKREEFFDLVTHPDELGVPYRSTVAVSPALGS